MRIALIDLGTVSVRCEIYSVSFTDQESTSKHPETEKLAWRREMLRLGSDLYLCGHLEEQGKIRARSVFSELRQMIVDNNPDAIYAAATSAFREAQDGPSLVDELALILGAPIRIITGEQEALLAAKGILHNEINLPDELLLVDIGGGSTEVSVCSGMKPVFATSLLLGAIRCHQLFLRTIPPREAAIADLRHHVRRTLGGIESFRSNGPIRTAVGSSGTARTLQRLQIERDRQTGAISTPTIRDLVATMVPLTIEEITALPGMEANRADIILAGAIILEEILDFFGAEQLRISVYSLRHGLLAEAIETAFGLSCD